MLPDGMATILGAIALCARYALLTAAVLIFAVGVCTVAGWHINLHPHWPGSLFAVPFIAAVVIVVDRALRH